MKIRVKLEPRDLWVGVYWTAERDCAACAWENALQYTLRRDAQDHGGGYHYIPFLKHQEQIMWQTLTVYVCLIPAVPIILYFERRLADHCKQPITYYPERR